MICFRYIFEDFWLSIVMFSCRDELKRLRKEFLDTQEDNAQLQKGKAGVSIHL